MAKFFKNFLSNVGQGLTRPKGNLGDFTHASNLYVKSNYRLAPKQKFLYHVVFNIHPSVRGRSATLSANATALNMLVKSVDLPKFKIQTETVQQYNRKRQIHTRMEYDPVNVIFHDDNVGISTGLWSSYYGYYFGDSAHGPSAGSTPQKGSSRVGGLALGGMLGVGLNLAKKFFGKSTPAAGSSEPGVPAAYTQNQNDAIFKYRYGLDNGQLNPFFTTIQIFQLSRRTYQCYTLVNPKITAWSHDNLNNSDGAGTTQNTMTISYESVVYGQGKVKQGIPTGFATEYYDNSPSPLSIAGGGTRSLFGQGGVIAGVEDILGDLSNPDTYKDPFAMLGTLVKGANTLKNAKSLTRAGIKSEILTAVTGTSLGGLSNTSFPKNPSANRNQNTQGTAPAERATASSLTQASQDKISNTPGALDSVVNLAVSTGAVAAGANAKSQVQGFLASGRNPKINSLANKVLTELK
jgi:hypothetical protein